MIQSIRGMNDILPPDTYLWQFVEKTFRQVLQGFGYAEIRFPILEKTELFKRSIGDATDIVEKEMYTFLDRNDESLSLRPEGTAACVRAAIQNGMLHNQIQRLWYGGPFFRYERPQKGRTRQFHQYSAEVFGLAGPDIDAEIIMLTAFLFEKLGIQSLVNLQINSLGSRESRTEYRTALVKYFNRHHADLDEDSQKRLDKNPLRILDSKNPDMQELISQAPNLLDYLDAESTTHFTTLKNHLADAGIQFTVNPRLVRGLDYYTKTVFEWVSSHLGAQGTVCAGGRYDHLVAELQGKSTPAVGFSLGMERTTLLMQQAPQQNSKVPLLDAYLMTDDTTYGAGLKLAVYLRKQVPRLRLLIHSGGGNLKQQFKKADKSGAQFGLILGEHELNKHLVTLKPLREDLPQQQLVQADLAEYLKVRITKK